MDMTRRCHRAGDGKVDEWVGECKGYIRVILQRSPLFDLGKCNIIDAR